MENKLKNIKILSCEKASEVVKYFSDKMIEYFDCDLKKSEIKSLFIETLNNPENYKHYAFGEVVLFFLYNADDFSQKEKITILKYICNNIESVCKSKNETVPTVLLDFVTRHIDQNSRKKYCKDKLKSTTDKTTKKCVEIILQGSIFKI